MKLRPSGRWVVAVAAAVAALAVATLLVRVPAHVGRPQPPAATSLRLGPATGSAADPLFSEDAALRDPTPLFLPTQWNSSGKEVTRTEPVMVFLPYPAKLLFERDRLGLGLEDSTHVPAKAAEALEDNPPGNPVRGLGRAEDRVPALARRSAFVTIVEAGSGRRVFSQALTEPPAGIADSPPAGGVWEFMAVVDAAGLVGPLVQTLRSGTEADGYFLRYLTESLRVGERLSPGFYHISIGP
jgi:hypothetical protein